MVMFFMSIIITVEQDLKKVLAEVNKAPRTTRAISIIRTEISYLQKGENLCSMMQKS
jgi:hypothetical protein